MKKKVFTSLGLMSGTSMDGVDLSLIRSDGNDEFLSILDDYCEFDETLRKNLINLREKIVLVEDLVKYSNELNFLERQITLFHAKIVEKVIEDYNDKIDLIGFHGQTIFHKPDKKVSRQLGDGKLLSQILKKIVISNFREKDINNDGQGAPLTPIFHKLLSNIILKKFKTNTELNFLNIGGISNLTHVGNNFFAFDIGPGNCLIDEWVRKNSKNKYDKNGYFADIGKIDKFILNQAIDNFNINSYDKSLDVNDFDLSFARGLDLYNGCATITNFSAYLISEGIKTVNKKNSDNFFLVCGGGRKNKKLIEDINEYLAEIKIKLKNIDDYGFNGDFIESQAFAYLDIRSFLKLPITFPKTTRCKSPSSGGTIYKNF